MFITINRKKIKYFEILLLVVLPTVSLKIIDSLLYLFNPFNTFINSTYIYVFAIGMISLSLIVWDRENQKTKFEFSDNNNSQKRRYILNIAAPYVMLVFFTLLTIFSSNSDSIPIIENYQYLTEDTQSNNINNSGVSANMQFTNETQNSNDFIEQDDPLCQTTCRV